MYAPHDLSAAEMQKWKRRGRPESDAFDLLGMNPVEEYKVCFFLSIGVTGRIANTDWPCRTSRS